MISSTHDPTHPATNHAIKYIVRCLGYSWYQDYDYIVWNECYNVTIRVGLASILILFKY